MTDDDDLLAAELAFGLIGGGEHAAAEQRALADAPFAQAVSRWRAHAAAMLHGPGELPRPSLWPQIEGRLSANDNAAPSARPDATRWWRIGTFAASAAAALLAVVALERPAPAPPVAARAPLPPLVALLTADGSKTVVAVSYDPVLGRLTLDPRALIPGAHSAELWVIPADKKPRSLGLVAPESSSWRPAPQSGARAIGAGATLAVSIEPVGGSPTGQPTGPVVLSGIVRTT